MEMKAKDLCRTALVAALYVALTTLNPLSWGAVQLPCGKYPLCGAALQKELRTGGSCWASASQMQ